MHYGSDKILKQYKQFLSFLFFVLWIPALISFPEAVSAQDQKNTENTETAENKEATPGNSVEINGDVVEYAMDGNKLTAKGNVVIVYKEKNTILKCDQVEFYRNTKIANAQGNVRLISSSGEIAGDKMTFNFGTMTGEFNDVKISTNPYYGSARKVSKVSESKMEMKSGHLTTCDLDKPHYRMAFKRADIYPKEKLVARSTKFVIGKLPILYIPKFTQRLDRKQPIFTFTPGYKKDWGAFVLTSLRFNLSDNFKGFIRFDAREKRGVAQGLDLSYKTPNMGSGSIKLYYMNELLISSKHFYQIKPTKTIAKERFLAQWRHKWDIDKDTNVVLQYAVVRDDSFIKDYFKRDYDRDSNPKTFFLLTKVLPRGVASFRLDKRVNRFEGGVERLPEITYDLADTKMGVSPFYFRNKTTYSNLSLKQPSPTEVRKSTERVDTDSQISYPMKLGIIEFQPFVGGEETYYSRTNDPSQYHIMRGIFKTGASLSTKFYKIFDVDRKFFGVEVKRLRHLITPTVSYSYIHDPTVPSTFLDQFDAIDSRQREHSINFGIDNKLQTKRDGKIVDLLRMLVSTDFYLKESLNGGGFNKINADIELRPNSWLTFLLDSEYLTRKDKINTVNFDMYIRGKDQPWSLDFGKRLNVEQDDDQITTEFKYKLNPLWAIKIYDRFDTRNGLQKAQEFVITRDLHCWTMDISFNETRGRGSEIMLIFTLKAFPDLTIDAGTGFNQRKFGSQSSEGE